MQRFQDRVALITGAASGIGRATAQRLASEGAAVACADVQLEGLEATLKQVQELGATAISIACDVSDPAATRAAVQRTVEAFGRLDALCNIAGILHFHNTHELPLEVWERILAVNLTGTFLMCQAALPHLLETRGAIVNTSSTAALSGHPWTAAYSASKGGVLSLTYTLAIEYGKRGVRCNAVCPGAIQTPITDAFTLPPGADRKLLYRIMPFDGEFRGPEVVASAIAYLASDEALHTNGTILRMDGGMLS